MNGAVDELSGMTLPDQSAWGLWWGHSLEYQPSWNSPDVTSLDLDEPRQVEAAFAELDRAAQAGATLMGLDAFSHRHLPPWKSYHWLLRMQQRHESMTFITEGCTVDFMHTLAPTWIDSYAANSLPAHRQGDLSRRHALADWLLPGHEIWAGMLFNRKSEATGTELPLPMMRREIARIAQLGYVPVIFIEAARPAQTLRATESGTQEAQSQPTTPPASTQPAQETDSRP